MKCLIDKNGWGLSTELGFILLFVSCLVISVIFANKFGVIKDMDDALNPGLDTKENYISYDTLEKKMIEGTKKYVNSTYGNDIGEDTLIIRVNHLIKNKYLNTLKDSSDKKCSGYVEVMHVSENSITYNPYLKCRGYQTPGYQERNDW